MAIPDYSLCPRVQVRDIVMQTVQAGAWMYRNASNFGAPAGRLYAVGHSAGGHLAAMLLACQWPQYAPDLPLKTVRGAISISGVYNFAAIVKAPSINTDVRLARRSALAVSPAFLPPASDAGLRTALGEREIEGFHIEDRLIRERWGAVVKPAIACPGDDHFSVLDRLLEPSSELFRAMLKMVTE